MLSTKEGWRTLLPSALALALVAAPGRAAGSEDATSIIRTGENRLRGRSAQSLMTMKVIRPDFTRELRLRAWTQGRDRALVEILEPAKETGIASLRRGTQMWNFLPKTDQVVRVPPSLMLQSWMGSDFTNDDLVKASSLTRDYRHRLIRTKGGRTLIQCDPKPGAPVLWEDLDWARKSDSLPVRQEYYDEEGKLVRTLVFSGFRRMDDRVVPTRIVVTRAEAPGESTVVQYRKILYDRQIPAMLFNRHRLRPTTEAGRNLAALWFDRKRGNYGKVTFVVRR